LAAAQGRTPLDLLSAALKGYLEPGAPGDVYAYGNGANYQLGTGGTGLQARWTCPGPQSIYALASSVGHWLTCSCQGRGLTSSLLRALVFATSWYSPGSNAQQSDTRNGSVY